MSNLDERITRFGALCRKASEKGLTREENREFKRLEKSITNAMMLNEALFDLHLAAFKKASKPLVNKGG